MEQALGYIVFILSYAIAFYFSMYAVDRTLQSIDSDYRQAKIYQKILWKEFRLQARAIASHRKHVIKLRCYKSHGYMEPLLPAIQLAFNRPDTTLEEQRRKAVLIIPIRRGLRKPVKKLVTEPEVKIVPRGA